ncbi:MAG: aldo/keto reductase [Deltaproteobacteria bacterium]|jgi:predicted aldo/keto reductase-like oxidoreductase|nr:aldo/keto reductase [Deltaproteobacteria bacterium]
MSFDENKIDKPHRRDFLKKAAAIGLGAAVGTNGFRQTRQASAQITLPQAPMPRRPFGRSGITVSTLSLGGMFDILNNRLMLAKALEWGIDYWDTAEVYGGNRSEEGIGRWFARNPDTRKQVFLVTKLSLKRGGDFTSRLEACLKRLHTDYIDLFFVHGISSIDEMDPGLKSWSRNMKKAGKLKLFGFSTHSNMEECLEGAARLPWIDGIMFTYNYRLMHEPRMTVAVEACYRAGIGLTAMKTQGGGPVKSDSESEIKMAGRFMKKGFTDHQAKLMAVWEDKRIASICSQMPNLTIMATNAAAAVDQARLSQSDRALLAQYARETCSDYCAGCGRLCSEALGKKVPINDVMRCLMYLHSYQDLMLARSTFETLPAQTRALLAQLDFSEAERSCPRNLPIGRMMQEATSLFA